MSPSNSCMRTNGSRKLPVTRSQQNSALETATAPNNPAMRPFCLVVMSISLPGCLAPPVCFDGAVGGKEAQRADAEEVEDVLQINGAANEALEVVARRRVLDELAHPAVCSLARGPADDEEQHQDCPGDEGRHHLRFGEGADEEADGA